MVAIWITDPDSYTDPDRDTGKTALAEVYTVPVLLVSKASFESQRISERGTTF